MTTNTGATIVLKIVCVTTGGVIKRLEFVCVKWALEDSSKSIPHPPPAPRICYVRIEDAIKRQMFAIFGGTLEV